MSSIFLCHASEDKAIVEPIQLALASAGCEVFYDEQSLPPGGDYQARIRAAVNNCDLFVFIASSASIVAGKFTLTELKFARERWPSPINRVLPVVIDELKPRDLPNYLQAATVLTVSGSAAAEVRDAVESMLRGLRRRRSRRWVAALVIGSVAFTLSIAALLHPWRIEQANPVAVRDLELDVRAVFEGGQNAVAVRPKEVFADPWYAELRVGSSEHRTRPNTEWAPHPILSDAPVRLVATSVSSRIERWPEGRYGTWVVLGTFRDLSGPSPGLAKLFGSSHALCEVSLSTQTAENTENAMTRPIRGLSREPVLPDIPTSLDLADGLPLLKKYVFDSDTRRDLEAFLRGERVTTGPEPMPLLMEARLLLNGETLFRGVAMPIRAPHRFGAVGTIWVQMGAVWSPGVR
jgi:hypothetical protein